MDDNTEGQLSLFAVDFLANHSVSPGTSEARKMTAHSGLKCYESYGRWSQLGSLAKMLVASSTWNSTRCFLTWKIRVTPHNRLLFQLAPSMPRTGGIESGLWQTPNASEDRAEAYTIATSYKHAMTSKLAERHQIHLSQQVRDPRLWPTPMSHEARLGYQDRSRGKKGSQESLTTKVINEAGERQKVHGQLNPAFVEFLMGFPDGWTNLEESQE